MDRQNLRMSFRPGRAGVNMQFTEISAELLVGFHIQRLIAKEQNLVLRQRLMQLVDLTVAEWLRQRDAFNIGTDARCDRHDTHRFIAHGMTLRWWKRRSRKTVDLTRGCKNFRNCPGCIGSSTR